MNHPKWTAPRLTRPRQGILGSLALVSLLVLGGAAGLIAVDGLLTGSAPMLTPRPVSVNVDGFLSWALLNRQTGAISGSANHTSATSSTESMIKIWIAADYLRLQAAGGRAPSRQRLDELTAMIRD
ncbi:MAG TPA: hypothetical protein VGP31_02695, partial [Planosporangium sp.]|nr:hypothetical protein [Planosporangium sp.]